MKCEVDGGDCQEERKNIIMEQKTDVKNQAKISASELVLSAVFYLQQKNGVTAKDITKYICEKRGLKQSVVKDEVKKILERATENGIFSKKRGLYRIEAGFGKNPKTTKPKPRNLKLVSRPRKISLNAALPEPMDCSPFSLKDPFDPSAQALQFPSQKTIKEERNPLDHHGAITCDYNEETVYFYPSRQHMKEDDDSDFLEDDMEDEDDDDDFFDDEQTPLFKRFLRPAPEEPSKEPEKVPSEPQGHKKIRLPDTDTEDFEEDDKKEANAKTDKNQKEEVESKDKDEDQPDGSEKYMDDSEDDIMDENLPEKEFELKQPKEEMAERYYENNENNNQNPEEFQNQAGDDNQARQPQSGSKKELATSEQEGQKPEQKSSKEQPKEAPNEDQSPESPPSLKSEDGRQPSPPSTPPTPEPARPRRPRVKRKVTKRKRVNKSSARGRKKAKRGRGR